MFGLTIPFPLWIMTILLLAVVLVAGTEVNGSTRWICIAGFTLQASEVAKVMMAIYCGLCGTTGKEVRSSALAYTAWSA